MKKFWVSICLAFFICHANLALFSSEENLNLLIITVDTLRADHLGVYGHSRIKTPNIDHLAEEGALFSEAYAHVPLTLPSHCSLFTGTLPIFHGVRDNGYRLPSSVKTLAEILKKNKYLTAAFVGAFPLDSRFGLNKGFDVYDDSYRSKNIVRDLSFVERKAEEVNERAIDWISRNKDKPFFVWIHYFDPHSPYEPPSPFDLEYRGREYEGEIVYTDSTIGKLLEAFNHFNLVEKTLIVLTSDHGEGLGEHKEATHGLFIYDSTLRVPLIFRHPKIIPKKKIFSQQVRLVDVLPTVLDFIGFPQKESFQGQSLKSLILGEKSFSENSCYIESVAAMLDRNWAPLQGIRDEEWKYIDAPIPELYDLSHDSKEENNVIEKNPQIARRLKEELQKEIKKNSSPQSLKASQVLGDKETRERLMSLGYITGRVYPGESSRLDPKTMIEVDNMFNEAINSSETGKLEEASQFYQEVLKRQPNFTIAYEYAAYNDYKMGNLEEAAALLEKALSQNLKSNSLLARLGLYYQEMGRIEESIDILEKVIKEDENYAEAHNYLGVSYFKIGEFKKAVASFKKALALDSDYALAMNNLGNCYLALKEYDLAREEYQKALSVDSQLASAWNGLGVVSYRLGLVEDALSNWEKSLSFDPAQPETLYNLGRVHLRLGHRREALKFFELFVQQASSHKYVKDIEEVRGVVERLKKELEKNSE